MIQTRFGLAKLKVAMHSEPNTGWINTGIFNTMLCMRGDKQSLHRKVWLHLEARLPIHQVLGHSIVLMGWFGL
jgi:hypothetical protein